jgi:hypothetical protein
VVDARRNTYNGWDLERKSDVQTSRMITGGGVGGGGGARLITYDR